MAEKVLFYYWAHSEIDELRSRRLVELVQRSDKVFLEFIAPDLEAVGEIEGLWNESIQAGDLVDKAKNFVQDETAYFLYRLMKGTEKRLVLERSLEADFDINEEDSRTNALFFRYPLSATLRVKEEYLQKNNAYQVPREKSVVDQILAVPGTVLVSFGAGHPTLAEQVSAHADVEVHFPYPDYPKCYETEMNMKFRKTGEIDKELFLRHMMDCMARKALTDRFIPRERDLISYYYASLFTPEQIEDYGNYTVNCSRFTIVTFSRSSSMSKLDIFESYLKREGLPLVEEAFELISNHSG